jgi:hypothetical protein
MATASTSAFELTRDGLIRRAFQLAGLIEASQQPSAEDIAMAADVLAMVLLDLQADGIVPTQVTRTTVALVAGTASYTLPDDTLDVVVDVNGFVGTIVPSSGSETPVHTMPRSDYVGIPIKTTEGTPTRVFVERSASVTLVFWPVPSATASFRYSQLRFARDVTSGSVTLDLSKRWQLALCYDLASHVALMKSVPLDRQQMLREEAEALKRRCRSSDVEKGHIQMWVARY